MSTPSPGGPRPHVAVAPSDHVYVSRVIDPDHVELMAAPSDDLVAWLAQGPEGADLLHLHIGLAHVEDLASVQTAARALGLPLVVTLHHHPGLGHEDSAVGQLCREAAAVIVHDPADAGVLRQRWDVDAYVQPYPHVADMDLIAAAGTRRRRPPWRVGIVRPQACDDSRAVHAAVARVAQERDDVEVVADSMDVQDPGHVGAVHWIESLDAIVLAGPTARRAWVELARDLGVAAVIPTAPAVVEPGVVVAYSAHGRVPLETEVARAITRVCGRLPAQPVDVGTRRDECTRVRDAHTALYRALSAATGAPSTKEDHDGQSRRTW